MKQNHKLNLEVFLTIVYLLLSFLLSIGREAGVKSGSSSLTLDSGFGDFGMILFLFPAQKLCFVPNPLNSLVKLQIFP